MVSLYMLLMMKSERESEPELVSSTINLELSYAEEEVNSEADLNHIYSMGSSLFSLSSIKRLINK